jgi:peptidoglycan hydrolase CwlO-like protein
MFANFCLPISGSPTVSIRTDCESKPMRLRRVLSSLIVLVLLAAAGAFAWQNHYFKTDFAHLVEGGQSGTEPSPAPQSTNQDTTDLEKPLKDLQSAQQQSADQIADLQRQVSSEEQQRKSLSDQITVLGARVDKLENAHAEQSRPTREHRGRR